jgi:hypothetical protein
LKTEAKTLARLSPAGPRQPRKSFLVLFFKKELLPFLPSARERRAPGTGESHDIRHNSRIVAGMRYRVVPFGPNSGANGITEATAVIHRHG